MIETTLKELGEKITRLRIARHLKQSELAYEAGISERTLQRMEAGEVVKTDGLLKVIAYLDKLDALLDAIEPPTLSPYELANRPGKRNVQAGSVGDPGRNTASAARRVRVRTSKKDSAKSSPPAAPGKITWPEDQA